MKKTKCPVCGAKATDTHFPFCSGRCLDEDLSKWLGGEYQVKGDETVPDGGE